MPPPCKHLTHQPTCHLCKLAQTRPDYRALWKMSPLQRNGPCRHLQEERERRQCATCKGLVELKVFGCAKHGLCTLGKQLPALACCTTCNDYQPRVTGPLFTFGMAAFKNAVEVWFTLQAFRALHGAAPSFEMLVVDNTPGGDAQVLAAVQECGGRYVRGDEVQGTAYPRDRVFREARGQVVCCVDSHVVLLPGSVEAILMHLEPGCKDLVHGPLLTGDHQGMHWTHWEPVWRDQLRPDGTRDWSGIFGTAASDYTRLAQGQPFDIPLAGCGLMACRKEAWVGFNPGFQGFGAEEGYLQEKFRRAGGRVVCVPGVRWTHKFYTLGGQTTRVNVEDLLGNYLIGHRELGLDETKVLDHFTAKHGKGLVASAQAKVAPRLPSPATAFGPLVRFDHHNLGPGAPGMRLNASLLAHQGGYLFAYREGWEGAGIGICPLDARLQPVGIPWQLTGLEHARFANYGREDPRLFWHNGRVHLLYVGVTGVLGSGRVRHASVLYARLTEDCSRVEECWYPQYFRRNRWEKSWGCFSHDGTLYAVYSFAPHRILRLDGPNAQDAFETPTPAPWKPGSEIRGGAPPVRVGDEWWVFMHSSKDQGPGKTYMMGLYTFSAEPPFRVLRIIPEPILVADWQTKPGDQYCAVVFPAGAVRESSGNWLVSMGIHDRWSEIWRFSHAELEKKLVKL